MSRKLRLGLVTSALSRNGAGVFEAVVVQARAMRATGEFEPVIFGLADENSAEDASRFEGMQVSSFAVAGPRAVGFAPGLLKTMQDADLDILHLHGIWMYPSAAAERWSASTRRPVVISPHGMLDPWILSRGRWKKAIARIGYERRSWKRAALFHALTETEAADIRKAEPKARVALIANGVTPPAIASSGPRTSFAFLSRIHPKKNVNALVEAWASLGDLPSTMGYTLDIAGFGEDAHVASLKSAIAAAASPTIRFVGPVFGADKAALLRDARFMVLPSLSEGLPMAILEAWAAGAPTIMSEDCNLPVGFAAGVAIRTGHSPQEIAEGLRRAMAIGDPEWSVMSDGARRLAVDQFSAEAIAAAWVSTYKSLI